MFCAAERASKFASDIGNVIKQDSQHPNVYELLSAGFEVVVALRGALTRIGRGTVAEQQKLKNCFVSYSHKSLFLLDIKKQELKHSEHESGEFEELQNSKQKATREMQEAGMSYLCVTLRWFPEQLFSHQLSMIGADAPFQLMCKQACGVLDVSTGSVVEDSGNVTRYYSALSFDEQSFCKDLQCASSLTVEWPSMCVELKSNVANRAQAHDPSRTVNYGTLSGNALLEVAPAAVAEPAAAAPISFRANAVSTNSRAMPEPAQALMQTFHSNVRMHVSAAVPQIPLPSPEPFLQQTMQWPLGNNVDPRRVSDWDGDYEDSNYHLAEGGHEWEQRDNEEEQPDVPRRRGRKRKHPINEAKSPQVSQTLATLRAGGELSNAQREWLLLRVKKVILTKQMKGGHDAADQSVNVGKLWGNMCQSMTRQFFDMALKQLCNTLMFELSATKPLTIRYLGTHISDVLRQDEAKIKELSKEFKK